MTSIPETCAPVNAQAVFAAQVDELIQQLCQTIGARLTALLVAIVDHILGRAPYVRRLELPTYFSSEGRCGRCGSTYSRRFSRNGFRERKPLLMS